MEVDIGDIFLAMKRNDTFVWGETLVNDFLVDAIEERSMYAFMRLSGTDPFYRSDPAFHRKLAALTQTRTNRSSNSMVSGSSNSAAHGGNANSYLVGSHSRNFRVQRM
jgi:hypothetical protein